MDGPFADSNGHGALMRIAPGAEEPSASARARVMHRCPQGVVAIALTPDSMVRGKAFERALLRFGRCLNAHGADQVPAPRFGSQANPWKELVWPLKWNSQLVLAAQKCVGPLRDFTLAG
jgi:hypothetical protein